MPQIYPLWELLLHTVAARYLLTGNEFIGYGTVQCSDPDTHALQRLL